MYIYGLPGLLVMLVIVGVVFYFFPGIDERIKKGVFAILIIWGLLILISLLGFWEPGAGFGRRLSLLSELRRVA